MLTLETERPVAGGRMLARAEDGRVVLIAGAVPEETVEVRVVEEHPRRIDAEVSAVVRAGAARVEPPCPAVAAGCGGCDWQHVDLTRGHDLRQAIVREALRRIGGLDHADTVPIAGEAGQLDGYRTTVRFAVDHGQVGLRRAHSHEVVPIESCVVAHPLVNEVISNLDPGEADEITVRVGVSTGDRVVVASPTAAGVHADDGVVVVGADELDAGRRVWFHEEAAGRTWRISARSFFQSGPAAAERLAASVAAGVSGAASGSGRLLDLYSGVGLFAGAAGVDLGLTVTAVERSVDAIADSRVNVPEARSIRSDVRRFRVSPADVVVADPARRGLAKDGVAIAVAARPERIVLVSCDPAALGRDAGLLAGAGYTLIEATIVDAFPGTSHVEVVSVFDRAAE